MPSSDAGDASPTPRSSKPASLAEINEKIRSRPVIVTSVRFVPAAGVAAPPGSSGAKPSSRAASLRTREWVLRRESRVSVGETQTFDDMKHEIMLTFGGLMSLDTLNGIEVICDVAEDDAGAGAGGPEDGAGSSAQGDDPTRVSLTFAVDEQNNVAANAGTYARSGEGLFELSANVRNRLGIAEKIEVNAAMGTKSTTSYSLSMFVPKLVDTRRSNADPETSGVGVDARAYREKRVSVETSSYGEHVLGTSVTLLAAPGSDYAPARGGARNDLAYEFVWREVSPTAGASRMIMRESGHNVKSAVRWTFVADSRDIGDDDMLTHDEYNGGVVPGAAMRSQLEVAGLGLDANFLRHIKHEMEVFAVLPVMRFLNATLRVGASSGIVLPWDLPSGGGDGGGGGGSGSRVSVCDRFFIGGAPSCLRGFHLHGVGPMCMRTGSKPESTSGAKFDAVGGDVMLNFFADLSFDVLPPAGNVVGDLKIVSLLRSAGMHGHVFVNGGNSMLTSSSALQTMQSTSMESDESVAVSLVEGNSGYAGLPTGGISDRARDIAERFVDGFRVSCGVGLVVPFDFGKLELNYCHILRRQETDRVRSGFQINFNTSYFD